MSRGSSIPATTTHGLPAVATFFRR